MIKVGIIGGDSQKAGGLLRILVHHPEVELVAVKAPKLAGQFVTEYHNGLIGDTAIKFSDSIDFEKTDVIFVASSNVSDLPDALPDDLKIIIVNDEGEVPESPAFEGVEFVPGVSEMFRKPLVRKARASVIPLAPISVSIIALFPLALNLLLNDSLRLTVKIPKYLQNKFDEQTVKLGLERLLRETQLSFNSIDHLSLQPSDYLRTIAVEIELECGVSAEEIERVYNDVYDDHNFSFVLNSHPAPTEVAGTQKCIITVEKPSENLLKITAIADGFMRGGAGDAIHAMNLLFGLYEKIGLSLPASMAFIPNEVRPQLI